MHGFLVASRNRRLRGVMILCFLLVSQRGYAQDVPSESDSSVELTIGVAEALCEGLGSVPSTSVAGELDEEREAGARSAYRRSSELYQQGAFDEALDHTCQAYRLKPTSDLLFNLAQVLRQLGRCEEATTAFRAYLAKSTAPRARSIAEKHLLALNECAPATNEPQGVALAPAATPSEIIEDSPPIEEASQPSTTKEMGESPLSSTRTQMEAIEEKGKGRSGTRSGRSTSLLIVSASAGVLAATAVGLRVAAGAQHQKYKETGDSAARTSGRSLEAAAFATGGGAIALVATAIWMSLRKQSGQPLKKTPLEAIVVPRSTGFFGSLYLEF